MYRKLYTKIKREQNKLLHRITGESASNIYSEQVNNNINFNESVVEEDDGINIDEIVESARNEENKLLKEKLQEWYYKFHPTREMCTALLQILRSENLDVPVSVNGLLNKRKHKIIRRTVTPGEYCHLGLKKQLLNASNKIKECEEIVIDIGVDGLPLFKSSAKSLWPIIAKIVNVKNLKLILIGAYLGDKKPRSVETYLHDFINEIKVLTEEGIVINEKKINVKIRAFICDAPARAFLAGIVGHNSFHGCSKCRQKGKYVNNVVTYSTDIADLRTDESFKAREDLAHHNSKYYNIQTALETINIKMVTQFPLDVMHLIDLGVTRKMLQHILKGKTVNKLSEEKKQELSFKLLALSPHIPREFARKPRSLHEILRFKSAEFKQFILYTGIFVLKNVVCDDIYYHFLLLHCAYQILSFDKSYYVNIQNK